MLVVKQYVLYFCCMRLDPENTYGIITSLILEVNELKAENKELKRRLAKYETPKNSSNSSIPPSKDENRPQRRSLREKTGRKPGGQRRRKGNTLKMVPIPDIIKKHTSIIAIVAGGIFQRLLLNLQGSDKLLIYPR